MNIHSIDSARELLNPQSDQDFGTVISRSKQGYLVKLESGSTLLASKAFSCAFMPEDSDYVAVMRSNQKGYYITNILERTSDKPALIETDSELHINSQKTVKLQSNSIELSSINYKVNTQSYDQTSEKLNVVSKHTQFQSETVESNVTRLIQRIKDSFKMIERLEQVTAQDIIQNIKNAFIQRSKQVDITAKSDVKINGDRIHMG
jgi:hypothetical protein